MTYKMIDVSSNNASDMLGFNWGAAKDAGYGAVMIKATEGLDYVNPRVKLDAEGAATAGFLIGYYHFAQPGDGTPQDQAAWHYSQIHELPRSLGCALDLEVANGEPWASLAQFTVSYLDALPAVIEHRELYTTPDWIAGMGAPIRSIPKWIASWGKRPRQQCWAWQSGQADVPGFPGAVDVGVLYL